MERLLHLEQDIDQLRSLLGLPDPSAAPGAMPPSRALWPGDELLLTRLVRRSPIALSAYQGVADITITKRQGVRLSSSTTASSFYFCELLSGDAVVWVQPNPPEWLWRTPTIMQLFHLPPDLDREDQLLPQTLPLFKPVVRNELWTLFRQGEMVNPSRLGVERDERNNPLRRLETMERKVQLLITTQTAEIDKLRHELAVIKDLFRQLKSLSGHNS